MRSGTFAWNKMRRFAAAVPGLVVLVRTLKNAYWGLRRRTGTGSYSIDGVAHSHMSLEESVVYVRQVFEDYVEHGGLTPEQILGARVLEIGPGDSLGVALLFVGAGASQVVAVDRFFTARDLGNERRLLAALTARQGPRARGRMQRCIGSDGQIAGTTIHYVHGIPMERAVEAIAGQRFDLIVSRSVLEHVFDIDATYASCRSLIRDGGRMVHKIDLSNHSDIERHPLQFLTYAPLTWRLMSSNISRINRCRWPQHKASMEENRFEIERFFPTRIYPPEQIGLIRSRLVRPFKEMRDEDLAIGGCFVTCRAV